MNQTELLKINIKKNDSAVNSNLNWNANIERKYKRLLLAKSSKNFNEFHKSWTTAEVM